MAKKNGLPVYMQVAIDIAVRITKRQLRAEQKLLGRSTLASEYNVSPETIRKAMRLLADMEIVRVKHGEGIFIESEDKAQEFIDRYRMRESIQELKDKVLKLMLERDRIEHEIKETMGKIADYTNRFKNSDFLIVYEEKVPEASFAVGKTLEALMLWQHTGATVVGIKRSGDIFVSPGPYEVLGAGDILLFMGEPNCGLRIQEYLNTSEHENDSPN
jgi:K+/H+ antiporter YhaU regulatory subunit KhtT